MFKTAAELAVKKASSHEITGLQVTTFCNKTLWKFRIVFYLLVVEELFIDSFFDDSSSSGRTLPVMLKMFNIFLFN